MSEKSLDSHQNSCVCSKKPHEMTNSCANHAVVTADSLSRNCPKCSGCAVTTITAFCTVDLVTSGDFLFSLLARICLVHDMPKRDIACKFPLAFRTRVK